MYDFLDQLFFVFRSLDSKKKFSKFSAAIYLNSCMPLLSSGCSRIRESLESFVLLFRAHLDSPFFLEFMATSHYPYDVPSFMYTL